MLGRVRDLIRWFCRYRSIRLTSEGTLFVLLTLAVGMAAINTGKNLLYLLLAMLLSLIVMSGVLSEQCLRHLAIRRWIPEHIFANHPVIAALSIANRKSRLASFSLRIMDVIGGTAVERGIRLLNLPPRATVTRSYPMLFPRRGRHRIEGIKLLTRFPFGLFIKAATLPLDSEILVYPEPRPLPKPLLHELAAMGHEQPAARRGQGVALYDLRRYRSGDDSRTIHWKTSARLSRLIVRETEAEDQRRVTLALATAVPAGDRKAFERAKEAFEQAVGLTASLAIYFQERDYVIRLVVGEQDIARAGTEPQLYRILRALALCEPTPVSEAPLPEGFRTLADRTALGELTILVVPWADPRLEAVCRSVSRVVQPSEFT